MLLKFIKSAVHEFFFGLLLLFQFDSFWLVKMGSLKS